MKVPPKRKGNTSGTDDYPWAGQPSMKVPPKRKGNLIVITTRARGIKPSMKVPPKRKGNAGGANCRTFTHTLNESPSEKEGKSQLVANKFVGNVQHPSMKVPPKRKGNSRRQLFASDVRRPSMKVPPKRKGNRELRGPKGEGIGPQ